MRRFSRHLPPHPSPRPSSWRARLVLAGLVALVLLGIYHAPLIRGMAAGIVALVCITSIRERRKIRLLKATRPGTICAFRRAFDCREVDPWIIRATYQEVRNWISGFPVEAEDGIREQLKMEDEDLDDLIHDIARRSGYGLEHTADNPWYNRVKTVGDLVHFINHQPKTRLA